MKIVLSEEQWRRFITPIIPEAIEIIKERKRQAKQQATLEETEKNLIEEKKNVAV